FQAEDGIRDKLVTGVQTCALPIFRLLLRRMASATLSRTVGQPDISHSTGSVLLWDPARRPRIQATTDAGLAAPPGEYVWSARYRESRNQGCQRPARLSLRS